MNSNRNTRQLPRRNSTIKTRFTAIFLISLSKIKRVNKVNSLIQSDSAEEIRKRSQRIKIASYSSMALAVGSRRGWSRALLFKLRNRARIHGYLRNRIAVSEKKKKKKKAMNKVSMLRKVVPGGNKMEICGLLEETAHYIKCLSTQVKVMQSIVDHSSI